MTSVKNPNTIGKWDIFVRFIIFVDFLKIRQENSSFHWPKPTDEKHLIYVGFIHANRRTSSYYSHASRQPYTHNLHTLFSPLHTSSPRRLPPSPQIWSSARQQERPARGERPVTSRMTAGGLRASTSGGGGSCGSTSSGGARLRRVDLQQR
jgi:hypothetical protein